MKRPPLVGIRHVALRVRDLRKMRAFYTDMLGFEVEWQPDRRNVYLTTGTDNLALHEIDEPGNSGSDRLDHIGLLVADPKHVDAWAAFLKLQGVHLRQEPKTHRDGARSIYLQDPEENVIQIIHHPPISGE
jgi:catechol 2,3-dioxygenase-like lactoylglutathione lyase family enzyme